MQIICKCNQFMYTERYVIFLILYDPVLNARTEE